MRRLPPCRRRRGRSFTRPTGRSRAAVESAARLMTRRAERSTVHAVRERLTRLRKRRIDLQKLDLVVAPALAVLSQLEAWLGSISGDERIVLAVAGPLMAATIALRRRFPAGAGIAAALLANAVAIGWKPPNAVSYGVAWICSIYGLTVWTLTREFALGVAAVAAPTFIAYLMSDQPHGGVGFSVIAVVVMLFVRHVVGDR